MRLSHMCDILSGYFADLIKAYDFVIFRYSTRVSFIQAVLSISDILVKIIFVYVFIF